MAQGRPAARAQLDDRDRNRDSARGNDRGGYDRARKHEPRRDSPPRAATSREPGPTDTELQPTDESPAERILASVDEAHRHTLNLTPEAEADEPEAAADAEVADSTEHSTEDSTEDDSPEQDTPADVEASGTHDEADADSDEASEDHSEDVSRMALSTRPTRTPWNVGGPRRTAPAVVNRKCRKRRRSHCWPRRGVRGDLRSLPKDLAEIVGRHLAAAGLLIDEDPGAALEHARYARTKAARIAVVREATRPSRLPRR